MTPLSDAAVAVRFVLVETRGFDALELSGNYIVSNKEILEAITLKPGDEFTEARWEGTLSEIASLYRRKGYFHATLTFQLKHAPSDRRKVKVLLHVEEGSRTKIRDVRFSGETVFSHLALILKIRSRAGEYYNATLVEEDVRRLIKFYEKAGYLKVKVGPPALEFIKATNEVEMTFPIEPSDKITLFFYGRGPISQKELERLILIKTERSDDIEALEASARQMEAFYRDLGYPFVKITASIERMPGQSKIYFNIERGAQVQMGRIAFQGNHTFSGSALGKVIKSKESGFFKRNDYLEGRLKEDTAALMQFYEKEGFRDVRIEPTTDLDPSHKSAAILFIIEEGSRIRIGQVAFKGNDALSEGHLAKGLPIRPDIPFNNTVVKEGARQILLAYSKEGYIYATVSPSTAFHEDKADIVYTISEGEQIRLGSIHLIGNRRTKDTTILRELLFHEGDFYNPEAILKSQQRLYRTNLFSSVRFEPIHQEERPIRQEMRLSVEERPNVAVDFGVGYGDYERFRGLFELSHRNLFGSGRTLSFRAEGSNVENEYSVNYKEPRFPFENTDARIGIAYIKQEEISFYLKTSSVTAGFDKSFSDTVKGALLYQYEQNHITEKDPSIRLSPEDVGKVNIASINPSLTRDTRDDPFNPKSGSVNAITLRNAAKLFGSEAQLVKMTVQSSWYRSLSSILVFAFSARVGVAERFGETVLVPPPERFLLGGQGTVRGYDQDRLGITGETLINGKQTGGNAMVVLNEEFRFLPSKSLGFVLFFDHGNVWESYKQIGLSQLKSSAGIGLRYNTPIGPLRLDWGYKLDREIGEAPSALHFTLGHTF